MRLFNAILLATFAFGPALASAQCIPEAPGAELYSVSGSVQAGALNQPDTVRLNFFELDGVTDLSLDTGIAHLAQATIDVDLATGKLAYFAISGDRNVDIASVAASNGHWFDRVCFDLPDGVTEADIQVVQNITGSIDCADGGFTCLNSGALSTTFQFGSQTISVPIRDLDLPAGQIVINATVVEGVTYPVQVSATGGTNSEGAIDFSNTLGLQFILPDGVSFESGSGVLLTVTDPGLCGDSTPNAGEACDDGNATNGDGCSSTCQVESGYECTLALPGIPGMPPVPPTPSVCTSIADTDGDGVSDTNDLCPGTAAGATVDAFGCSDEQLDSDGDGVNNGDDNCPDDTNPDQANQDGDALGDVCDDDVDGDGHPNVDDNCPTVANPGQDDFDEDGDGDACDDDDDGDGVADGADACAETNIPELSVPGAVLKKNRYVLSGDPSNTTFESRNKTSFTTADTEGCSCEQIIDELGLGGGHVMFGCSKSAMKQWIDRP